MKLSNPWIAKNLRNLPSLQRSIKANKAKIEALQSKLAEQEEKEKVLTSVDEIYRGVALHLFSLSDRSVKYSGVIDGRGGHVYETVNGEGFSGEISHHIIGVKSEKHWLGFGWTEEQATFAMKEWIAFGRRVTIEEAQRAYPAKPTKNPKKNPSKRSSTEAQMKVSETLQSLRKKAAQEAFENAEIDGLEGFEDTWNVDRVFWSRKIYREAPSMESKVGSFGIRFHSFSDAIAETWQN